jgi:phosphonate transport system permease protein
MSTELDDRLADLERSRRLRQGLGVAGVVATLVVTYLGLQFVQFEAGELAAGIPEFLTFIGSFFPPDFTAFTIYTFDNGITGLGAIPASIGHLGESLASPRISLVRASIVTLLLGFLGTVLGFPFALFFGVLGSERVMPFPLNFLFRGTMSAIRAIPAIVWIFLFIPLGPPGQATAVLAIATDTIGNLGRLFTDELEEIDEGPIEAIRSTGADGAQVVSFGMLSQVSTSFIAWTLYILEINTRIAISLGVVGAGGLGFYIRNSQDLLRYRQTAAGIIMVFVVVLSIELISSRLRARLRPSEHEHQGFLDSLRGLLDGEKWIGRNVGKN